MEKKTVSVPQHKPSSWVVASPKMNASFIESCCRLSSLLKMNIPYDANRLRWKSFSVAWSFCYSLENFHDWRLIRKNRKSFPPQTICIIRYRFGYLQLSYMSNVPTHIHACTCIQAYHNLFCLLSLGTLVPNSRDWHEKIATEFFTLQNTP